MSTQWSYGQLTIIGTANCKSANHAWPLAPLVAVGLLSDARQTRVIKTWSFDETGSDPQDTNAVMDLAGQEGWIVGAPSWVAFSSGMYVPLLSSNVPGWITAALRNVEGLSPNSNGYTSYFLRKAR
jgi:hypothetical protein